MKIKKVLSIVLAVTAIISCMPNMESQAAEKQIPSDATYYNGSYYYVYEDASSWEEAQRLCVSRGGNLAVITSEGENNAVSACVGYKRCWFGLYKADDGTWKWVTGEKNSYMNWDNETGQPEGYSAQTVAGYYDWGEEGRWHDISNYDNVGRYVCEWKGYKLSVNQSTVKLKPGKSTYLGYTVTGLDGTIVQKNASWKSSNIKVAKVSSKGKVVAVNPGVCKITCKAVGIQKNINIIVEPKAIKKLSVKAKTKNSVQLKWKKQKGVSGYMVYMYDADLEEYVRVKKIKKNITSVTVKGLKKGTKYRFKVCAYVKSGSKNYRGDYSKVCVVKTPK